MKRQFELFVQHCWDNGISQSDPDKERFSTVGRSEFYSVASTSKARIKVARNKVFGCNIASIAPINFGNTFEMSTQLLAEFICNCEIKEMPASYVRHDDPRNSASLDGIALVPVSRDALVKILTNLSKPDTLTCAQLKRLQPGIPFREFGIGGDSVTEVPALFEFKSAMSRVLNGKVKPEYRFQVLSGLDVFPICKIGIFFETSIKCCLEKHHWFNRYHYVDNFQVTHYNGSVSSVFPIEDDDGGSIPSVICMKYLFDLSENNELKKNDIFHHNVLSKPTSEDIDWRRLKHGVDYDEVDGPMFMKNNEEIIIQHNSRMLEIYDYREILPSEFNQVSVKEFYAELGNQLHFATDCFAYVPWKLVDFGCKVYLPYPNFCKKWDKEVNNVLDVVKDARTLCGDEEKEAYIASNII